MTGQATPPGVSLEGVLEHVNLGVVVVDRNHTVVRWNEFMATSSGRAAQDVLGRNLFEACPELPQRWLEVKLRSVILLRNYAFTSWEQRPHLFRLRPGRVVTEAVDCMVQDCTFIPILDGGGEVTHICITVLDVTDVSLYQTRLQESLHRIEELSTRDGLTGIYNRRYLESLLAQELARIDRYGGTISVVLFDLDEFKGINDSLGHGAGDEVLRQVARRVQQTLRNGDHCGRYGGEEFVLILPETGLEGAAVVAERMRLALSEEPVVTASGAVAVSATLGVAELGPDETADSLLDRADQALYRGKRHGRNRVECAVT